MYAKGEAKVNWMEHNKTAETTDYHHAEEIYFLRHISVAGGGFKRAKLDEYLLQFRVKLARFFHSCLTERIF